MDIHMNHSDTRSGPGPDLMGAHTLLGNSVYNHKAEEVGDKLFAVPWNALSLDTSKRCFVLNVDKERLDKAPGFDKGKWPDLADPAWEKEIHAYYSVPTYPDNATG